MIFALVSATSAHSAMLTEDCKPAGLINLAKEKIDSREFWANALKDIDKEVSDAQTELKLFVLQTQNDKIRNNLLNSEMRILGAEPTPPEVEKVEMEANRIIYQMHLDILIDMRKWSEKCRPTALSKR